MLGDSDKGFSELNREEREEGEEEIPTSSQELLHEFERERTWQQTQSSAVSPAQYAPPEPLSEDNRLESDAASTFSTSSLPPWPTRSASAARSFSSAAGGPPTVPMTNQGQPLGDDRFHLFSPPVAAPSRRSTQQRGAPPAPPRNQVGVAASPAGDAFPGWSNFRRRSPWLVPLIFVFFFFALVLLVRPTLALPLLFIFAAIGVLEVAVLLYVPSDAFWVVGVVASFVLMMAVAFFAFFTPIFASALSVLLVALGIVAIRERYYPVKEGTVAVMGLFEKYNRTLQPGFNLRVPGEKVLGIVSTHREHSQAHIPSLTLATGEHIALDVGMSYQVIPGQEYLAVRNTKDWKEPLKQLLVEVTQDVVSSYPADAFSRQSGGYPALPGAGALPSDPPDDEQEQSPLSWINDRLTQEMRAQVADRGVVVQVVKIRLQEGLPASGRISVPGRAPAPASPGIFTHPTNILPTAGLGTAPSAGNARPAGGPPTRPLSPLSADEPVGTTPTDMLPTVVYPGQALPVPQAPKMPIAPPPRAGVAPAAPEPTRPPLLSPQALKEMYKVVMQQRVTDIDTIRRIVMQFETVANTPALSESEEVDFDAAKAAQHLRTHLSQLEALRAAQLSSSPSEEDAAPSAPQTPWEPDED